MIYSYSFFFIPLKMENGDWVEEGESVNADLATATDLATERQRQLTTARAY